MPIVLGLRRRGEVNERPSITPLLPGDMLLVEGKRDALQALSETRGFLVVGTPAHPEQRPGKLVITIADTNGRRARCVFRVSTNRYCRYSRMCRIDADWLFASD